MTSVLRVQGVTKRFAGIVAVDNVSIEVGQAERVGLIGPNGAGKTTFFNCMLGMLPMDAGTVELDGVDVTRLPVQRRARMGIGRTFQRIELFAGATVREHLFIAERVRRGHGRLWKDALGLGRPHDDELEFIHDRYINELIPGIRNPETRERMLRILDRMKDDDRIDGLILGGTELPLILGDEVHNGVPILDTTKIHVARAVEHLL